MARVYIRRSKSNPDIYEVMNGTTVKGRHQQKQIAINQANAIRRVKIKRAKRKNK